MPELGEYNGNVTIVLNPDSKYPVSFGLKKAEIILQNLAAIKAFVATGGRTCDPDEM